MRAIKFRAWDENIKSFHYFDFNNYPNYLSMFWEISNDENLPISQFTGLTDKNGKEIYEGDQLHSTGYLCTVIFENGCFKSEYKHPEDGEVLTLEELGTENYVVVGNIHEHTELLNTLKNG